MVPLAQAPRHGEGVRRRRPWCRRRDIGWGQVADARRRWSPTSSAEASLVCFGRPFLRRVLRAGERGSSSGGASAPGAGSCSARTSSWSRGARSPPASAGSFPSIRSPRASRRPALRTVDGRARWRRRCRRHRAGPAPDALARARASPAPARRCAACISRATRDAADKCRAALAYEELFYFEIAVLRRKRALAAARPRVREPDTRPARRAACSGCRSPSPRTR